MIDTVMHINDTVKKRRIQTLCGHLLKSGGLFESQDYSDVTEMAIWLYLYGYNDEAILACDIFQNETFQYDYVRWNNIDRALCLKSRILRETGKKEQCAGLIETVNAHRVFELYENFARWFQNTLEDEISLNLQKDKKARVRELRILKLEMAIAYREAGQFPMTDEALETIINEVKNSLIYE